MINFQVKYIDGVSSNEDSGNEEDEEEEPGQSLPLHYGNILEFDSPV